MNNPTDTPVAGETDLRQAITLANSIAGAATITFDPTVFATPQTITLGGTQLALSNTTRDGDDHGPGGGRDGQRQPREPGVPGQRERHGVDLGTDDQRGHRDRRRRRTGQPRHGHADQRTLSGNSASTLGGGLYNNGHGDADQLHRQRQLRQHQRWRPLVQRHSSR